VLFGERSVRGVVADGFRFAVEWDSRDATVPNELESRLPTAWGEDGQHSSHVC